MRPSSIFDAVRAVANRVRGLGTRDTERADLEAELHFHREQLEAELRNRGLTPAEARRQAAVRLGNTVRWVEGGGDAWRFGRLESVVQDARVAARQWGRTPLTAAIAVLSLAIGVGFNTGISSLVNAAILRPLPVPAPEALRIVNTDGEAAGSYLPWPLIQRLREEGRPALALAAVTPLRDLGLDHEGVVALTPRGGSLVSDNYFEMLGVQPALGRLFRTGDEDEGTADHLVVLSHAFWQTTFGGDSTIVGRTLRFNGTSMQVIGVAARGFTGTQAGAAPDAWFPLTADDALLHRNAAFRSERTNWWVQAIGRQAAGEAEPEKRLSATLRAFRMELEGPDASAETQAGIAAAHITLEDGRSGFGALRVQYAGALELLWGLSLLVWLITLVNVATLLLGRLRSRDLEFAVRRAMGASRARITWQVAAEGGWLAAGGIVLALVVLPVGGPAARAWLFPAAARLHLDYGVDATMGMAIGISIVVSFLALAVFPALATAARTPSGTTTGDGRVAARSTAGRMLSAAQCALALPLVVTALLVARSVHALRQVPLGFSGEDVTVVRLDATRNDYTPEQMVAAYRGAMAEVRAIPGVRAVSMTRNVPLTGSWSGNSFRVEGTRDPVGSEEPTRVQVMYVDPDYFRVLRAPVLAGREFTADDAPRRRGVAVVSEQFARRHFGAADAAVGRHLARGPGAYDIEIVGVVANARLQSVRQATEDVVYQPYLADAANVSLGNLVLAADQRTDLLAPAVREAIRRADARLEVLGVSPFRRYLDRSVEVEQMVGRLSAVLATLAILLAALGIYGVFSHEVSRRRKEIGVRLALGASPVTVRRWILASAGQVFVVGVALGIPAAWMAVRAARSLLFDVAAADPLALAGAGLVFTSAFLLAASGPAARAARLDPLTSLRAE